MSTSEVATGLEVALKAVAAREQVTEIYFVACGGSYALMMSGQYIIERESASIAGFAINAAEFLNRAPKRLGKTSVVILCSHSGTTPETVAAARFARNSGALVIGFTHAAGSPLDRESDHAILYTFDPLTITPTHNAPLLISLAFGILATREGNTKSAAIARTLEAIPAKTEKLLAEQAPAIAAFAESHKREPVIYTMASAANYGTAYSFAICILQEMQWVHAAAIHAGEYFHGPFEITDFDVPFVILLGLGAGRTMDERALAFAQKYSQRLTVLDARSFGIEELAGPAAEYLTPMMFAALLRGYAVKLADSRGHPLTVRRYMWRMEY
ncbi:MAG: SIS domain-containing protein [Azospirillaceae bacterium]|nr:SIS domain-containing protein [Azospirillaceae bacterium]